MHSELPRSPEIYGDKSFDEALHFTDTVITGRRPVVDELSFLKVLVLPRPTVKGRNRGKQLKAVWNLEISHDDRAAAFNGSPTRWFALQVTKT